MEDWILFVVMATVILAPQIACPMKLFDGYILPQIGGGAIGIAIALLFWIYNGSFVYSFINALAFIYFVYLMTSGAWSTVPHNSLRDIPLIFLSVFSFLICSTLFENKSNIVGVSLAIFCSSMFISLYAIGQRFRFDPLFPERTRSRAEDYKGVPPEEVHKMFRNKNFVDSRAIATIGNTNFAAGYFLSTIPFLMYLSFEISHWFLLSILVVSIAIFCTESRAGILSLFTFLLAFILMMSKRGFVFDFFFKVFGGLPDLLIFSLCLLILLIGSQLIIYAKVKNPLKFLSDEEDNFHTMLDWENDSQSHYASTLRYRSKYWKIAIELIKKRPLQGYGLRTYRREVYYEQALINKNEGEKFLRPGYYQTPQPRECHNDFLENFVEGGIIGGVLFILIIFILFHNIEVLKGTLNNTEYILVCGVMSGIIGFLVEVFFFFPLRLGSSALVFWMSLALLQSFVKVDVIAIPTNSIWLVLLISVALMAMLWEGVIKPNLSNYYFTKFNFVSSLTRKEQYIRKAVKLCPKDSILRTHLLIGYLEGFPTEADFNAEMLRHHYDGMTPAWVSAYNCGIVKIKKKQYEEAEKFLQEALFFLPSFDAARIQLSKILPYTPIKRRMITMKQMTEEGINAVRHHQEQVRRLQEEIQKSEANFINIVLNEKIKMGIPIDWPVDPMSCQFFNMSELPHNVRIVEIGPTRLPLIIREAAPEEEQAAPVEGEEVK